MDNKNEIPIDTSNSINKNIRTRNLTSISKAVQVNNKETKNDNLIIYQKYLELINYSNNILRKYPKKENFSLVQEIKNSIYVGLRSLLYAIKSYNKQEKLRNLNEFDINLTLLKIQVRLSHQYKYITIQNYETWSSLITDICNMLGGWIISCQKR